MKSNIYSFLFFLVFFTQNVKSQEEGDVKKNYIPNITVAPPQAASISKVGEIPIDISTGRMNYTIPIFEIKEGSFSMPINLSYNYSGLILDETPGYAGVGWVFNMGGSILHSINGLDDVGREYNKETVYKYINKLPPYDDYSTAAGLTTINHYLENVSNGVFDGEPDKYSVNAGNLNCSFYIDKDNNAIFLKNENYKVVGYSHSGFTITDDQGVNYIFNRILNASKSSGASSFDYISSFLLTEINFPSTPNKIVFEYETTDNSYTDINISQTLTQNSSQYGIVQSSLIDNNKTSTIVGTNKLKKITTSTCTIELQYSNNSIEPAIAVINNLSVKDKLNKIVKSYDFTYSSWTGRRTNLLNVKYNGVITNEMEYDMSLPYPVLQVDSDYAKKDLWGYYDSNGIPVTYSNLITPFDNPTLKPDFASTKIGALTKITYQTKGYSLIDYEPNSIYTKSGDYNFPYDADSVVSSSVRAATTANSDAPNENIFVVSTVPAEINIVSSLTNHTQINPYADRDTKVMLFKEGQSANPIYQAAQFWSQEQTGWIPPQLIFTETKKIIINEIGTYRITANSTIGSSATLDVSLKQRPEYFNQTVGGMRVKQVQNCDFDGKCITTIYNYTQSNKSTGLMLQKPEFYSGYHLQDNSLCAPSIYVKRDFYNYTSIYPLSTFRGSPVLYKIVEKIDFGRNANNQLVDNGKTIFSYYGQATSNSILDLEAPFLTGLLDKKIIQDNTSVKVAKESNTYGVLLRPNNDKFLYILNCKLVQERRFKFSEGGGGCALTYPRPLLDFQVASFKHQPKNYILQQEKSVNYFKADSLVQTVDYDYNLDSGLLKGKKKKNSKAEDLQTKYFYPTDIEMASEPFRNELILKNMIGIPLVTQNHNGAKLSDQKTEYINDASTSNLLLPKYVYANKGIAEIDKIKDKKITYDKYDEKGNILQYTLESGVPVSIIWGYNKTQPIAKIENLVYASIPAGTITNLQTLSDADNDNCMSGSCTEQLLRNGLDTFRGTLPNAFISTYTYNPLVGVTSVTDPKGVPSYYEYDSFNRLKFVKDKDLNVLQKYCYNYKGQQVDCSDNTSTSVVLYKSIARSGSFTRNNCASGGVGSSIAYSQGVGASTSTTSQADADAKGLAKFNTDGQANANTNGICTFSSIARSGSFTRNNCASGGVGSSVAYTQGVGASTSTISQADADTKGLAKFNTDGQANANTNGICTFSSIARSGSFTRNNCASGGVGSSVAYSQGVGASTSTTSQADADAKGLAKFNTDGQTNANTNGTCTFSSIARSGSFTRNNCASGGVGSSIAYSQGVGASTSTTSQADADAKGLAKFNTDGQANANTNGICTFSSIARSGSFTRNNCASGGVGSSVAYSQGVGASTSATSQADADAKGLAKFNTDGQANANTNGICTFSSIARSGSFTRNNCASGGVGSSVAYSQGVGASTSTTSQADADAKGLAKFNADGQANANANGYCTFRSAPLSGSFQKTNCTIGGVGSFVGYSLAEGTMTSNSSQADADAQASTRFNNEGRANANAYGDCTFRSAAISNSFQKTNCAAGGVGSFVSYGFPEGAIILKTSQADVDARALANLEIEGATNANANGYCTFSNIYMSKTGNKNDCGAGKYGSASTYVIQSGTYTSTISQLDANNKAQADLINNYQAYANANGTCSSEAYDASMSDYDSNMKMVWITVTCNSASHPARTVSVTVTYKYPLNQINTVTKDVILPANSTNSTLQMSLTFVGVPSVQSYTVN